MRRACCCSRLRCSRARGRAPRRTCCTGCGGCASPPITAGRPPRRSAAPVCLDLVAPPAGGGEGVGLEPAGGAARALELHLPALHPAAASAVAADELLQRSACV